MEAPFFQCNHRGGVLIVTLRAGLLDAFLSASTLLELSNRIRDELVGATAGAKAVVIDLRCAGSVGTGPIGCLLGWTRRLRDGGGRVAFCGSPAWRRHWELNRLQNVRPMWLELEEAVLAVAGPPTEA